jgi:hypothetical protein
MKNVPAAKPSKNRSENRTGNGMKNVPADRFEIRTGIQIKQIKKTLKQQGRAASLEEKGTYATAVELLEGEGFDRPTAEKLAASHDIERIVRQIEWIDGRNVRRNRTGMLRLAIEQDWSKPVAGKLRRLNSNANESTPMAEARDQLAKHFNSLSS